MNFALLILRLTIGTLMAGHGSQKLFGWFKGPGLQGTHGMMGSLGMEPSKVWGTVAALGESTGGLFTALGLFGPLGPLNIAASMTVAARRVHWKIPVWASAGGAELPATNLAASLLLAIAGPGRFSLDRLFGIRIPKWLAGLMWLHTIAVTAAALQRPQIAQTILDKVNGVTGKG